MKNSSSIVVVAALAGLAGAASAGTVTVRYTPFQTGSGGEFRIERGTGYSGEINKKSDVDGQILTTGGTNGFGNNNASNGKVLAASGQFWQTFSRADGGTTNARNNNRAASNNNRNISDFQTFCIERTETVLDNTTYRYSIDTYAIRGGNGNGGAPVGTDPLSAPTAWLYTQFRNDTLAGYNMWGSNLTEAMRESSAKTLQHALWYFENELGGNNSNQTLFTTGLANFNASNPNSLDPAQMNQARTWAIAAINAVNAGWTNTNVRVLNLWRDLDNDGVYDNGEQGQSQLTLIPLPTAGGLACAGLALVGLRRRRSL